MRKEITVAETVIDELLENEMFLAKFCAECPAIPRDITEECPAGWRPCEPECYRKMQWDFLEEDLRNVLS